MGDKQDQAFQFSRNSSVTNDFQGSRVTSYGGMILGGKMDGRLGFSHVVEQHVSDPRRGKNPGFSAADPPPDVALRLQFPEEFASGPMGLPDHLSRFPEEHQGGFRADGLLSGLHTFCRRS